MSDDISDQIRAQLHAQTAALRDQISVEARSMLPGWPGSSPEYVAAVRAKREAAAVQQLAAVMVEWEAVRAQAQAGPLAGMLLALLDLHKPYTSFGSGTCCQDCMGGSYDAEPVDWPCETYEIIRDGLT